MVVGRPLSFGVLVTFQGLFFKLRKGIIMIFWMFACFQLTSLHSFNLAEKTLSLVLAPTFSHPQEQVYPCKSGFFLGTQGLLGLPHFWLLVFLGMIFFFLIGSPSFRITHQFMKLIKDHLVGWFQQKHENILLVKMGNNLPNKIFGMQKSNTNLWKICSSKMGFHLPQIG